MTAQEIADLQQRVVEAERAFSPCTDHQPDRWEGDGTCVVCEGNTLLARAEAAEQRLAVLEKDRDNWKRAAYAVNALFAVLYGVHPQACPKEPQL